MSTLEVRVFPKEGHIGEEVQAEADTLLRGDFEVTLEKNIVRIQVSCTAHRDRVRVALANMERGELDLEPRHLPPFQSPPARPARLP